MIIWKPGLMISIFWHSVVLKPVYSSPFIHKNVHHESCSCSKNVVDHCFFEVAKLLIISLSAPVSSASGENSFLVWDRRESEKYKLNLDHGLCFAGEK